MYHCPICDDDQATTISANGYCPACEEHMANHAKDPRTLYQRELDERIDRANQAFVNKTQPISILP